jgi:hypothetical protein
MTDTPERPRTFRRRCMVKGCKVYARWIELPPGEEPLPTDHPNSHYSMWHADPADVSPMRKFARAAQ